MHNIKQYLNILVFIINNIAIDLLKKNIVAYNRKNTSREQD